VIHSRSGQSERSVPSGASDVWFAAAISVVVTLGLAVLLKILLSNSAICIAGRTC
jgi:hypothetical protein